MLVGNDYKVEADNLNITLSCLSLFIQWRAIGFFSKFGNALKALVDLEVRETGQGELYKMIDALQISNKGVK